jgi:hypothetical protein
MSPTLRAAIASLASAQRQRTTLNRSSEQTLSDALIDGWPFWHKQAAVAIANDVALNHFVPDVSGAFALGNPMLTRC